VVDDGSNDQSASVAKEILQDTSTSQIITVPHGGQAAARNAGAKIAHGDLLLFTDADCEPLPNWIERISAVFSDPNVAGAKGIYCTRQQNLVARFVQQEYQDKYDRLRKQATIDFIDTYSAAYRRDVFLAHGGFNSAIAIDEDQEFSFRLSAQGQRLILVPDAVVAHQHVTSTAQYMRRKFHIGYWKAYILRLHPDKTIRDSHTPQSMKAQMGLLAIAIGLTAISIAARQPIALTLIAWSVLIISMFPFLIKIARRDPIVLLIAPVLIMLRALTLGVGLGAGIIRFGLHPPSTSTQE
jgi:GT2 family glycosyltransferase